MKGFTVSVWTILLRSCWLRSGIVAAGLLLMTLGCTHEMAISSRLPLILAGLNAHRDSPLAEPEVTLAGWTGERDVLPPAPVEQLDRKPLPITLDTVLRMAGEQNAQIAVARERVNEAFAELSLARHPRLSDLHEATFKKVSAEAKIWQQKAEVSRTTTEVLLDAGNTYIDLLTIQTGESTARELEQSLQNLLKRAKKLHEADGGAKVQVEAVQAQLKGLHFISARLRQRRQAASAKLAYLLGLGPDVEFQPRESRLEPINLVDASSSTRDLVAQALAHGPGIQEMEGLIAVINDGLERSKGLTRHLASISVRGRERRRVAESKLQQAQISYQDIRGKLALGVRESHEAILTGREQIQLLEEQLRHAREVHKLSNERLAHGIPGSSITEVLQTIRGLELAHLEHVTTLNSYNKAQLRLMLLLRASEPNCPLRTRCDCQRRSNWDNSR